MRKISIILSALCLFLSICVTKADFCISRDDKGQFQITNEMMTSKCLAFANYVRDFETKGFDNLFLRLGDKPLYSDEERAYAAGYLEGYITFDRIFYHYSNIFNDVYQKKPVQPDNIRDFLVQNRAYLRQMYRDNVQLNPDKDSENFIYWNVVYAVQLQIEGITDGYNAAQKDITKQLTLEQMHTVSSFGDMIDLFYYENIDEFPDISAMTPEEVILFAEERSHCSAIIKASVDLKEIWFGHNTWFPFSYMTRINKEYEFDIYGASATNVITSSYPGTVSSMDDFFITGNKLLVMETTNPIFDKTLYNTLTPNSLLYSHRSMAANRIAQDGKQWAHVFTLHNSGTYNNQFMVLNANKFTTGEKPVIQDGTLWILEQMPSMVVSMDRTDSLRLGYWPSYNTPYYKDIRIISGLEKAMADKPEIRVSLDYNQSFRSRIFRRDQGSVLTKDDFKALMRSNNYTLDLISNNNPSFAISARGDLGLVGKNKCAGAYDAKVASLTDIIKNNRQYDYIAGPSEANGDKSVQYPYVSYSQGSVCEGSSHLGFPTDYLKTGWLTFFSTFKTPAQTENKAIIENIKSPNKSVTVVSSLEFLS